MANTIRIKRRAAGGAAGAPTGLANAELAFNEQDNTLYYGTGTGGVGGSATSVIAIGGSGAFSSTASPAFTGTPTATTAAVDNSSTRIATTAFVVGQASSTNPLINGTVSIGTSTRFAREDHVHASDTSRAALASPTFTGAPLSTTAVVDTNTTQIATTAFVLAQAAATAPGADGTAAVGSSTRYARQDHVHPTDTTRAATISPTFTGTPISTTAVVDTNTTQIATTAFVLAQASSTNPAALGTAAVGTSNRYARQDHVHPTDTTRAALASPTFTGTPFAPTAALDTNTTQIATTAFVIAQDTATRGYVDLAVQGLNPKASVKAASTANIASLFGLLTIDGVTLAAGNRVLVKDQTTASANGVYIAGTAAWTRALDMSTFAEHTSAYLFVEQGTTNADIGFLCTTDSVGTLDTTAIAFAQFTGAGSVTLASITGTLTVGKGGTGTTTLTGYVKGTGTTAMTASATIPNTDISGLGTMSTQAATAVAITGGSIINLTTFDGITVDGGSF